MISVEELAYFDSIIWLRTGENVAERHSVSQPTVSRSLRHASKLFDITLAKSRGEWIPSGNLKLLNLERRVHQEYRWSKGLPLRIDAQYYSGPLYCDPLPEGWMAGNFDYLEIQTPLRNIRNGVIDAWIGCYPDVPGHDDSELTCFHLTRSPTFLVVSATHPLAKMGKSVTLDDVSRYPSLALPDNSFPKIQAVLQSLNLWNTPRQVNRYEHKKWEGQVVSDAMVGYATALSLRLFDESHVILPVSIPLEVGESLVVKKEYASHPRLLNLIHCLNDRSKDLALQYPGVILPPFR